jgi:hypothetical protein
MQSAIDFLSIVLCTVGFLWVLLQRRILYWENVRISTNVFVLSGLNVLLAYHFIIRHEGLWYTVLVPVLVGLYLWKERPKSTSSAGQSGWPNCWQAGRIMVLFARNIFGAYISLLAILGFLLLYPGSTFGGFSDNLTAGAIRHQIGLEAGSLTRVAIDIALMVIGGTLCFTADRMAKRREAKMRANGQRLV